MKIDSTVHLPWAQLPVEARFCFILFFSGVFGPEEFDRKAVIRELARIWDLEQLSIGFMEDQDHFWALYGKYQFLYREGVWRLEAFGTSREEAERAGFIKLRTETPIAHLYPATRTTGRLRRP